MSDKELTEEQVSFCVGLSEDIDKFIFANSDNEGDLQWECGVEIGTEHGVIEGYKAGLEAQSLRNKKSTTLLDLERDRLDDSISVDVLAEDEEGSPHIAWYDFGLRSWYSKGSHSMAHRIKVKDWRELPRFEGE